MSMLADVAIVGAGIVGLAHAWAAAKRGKRVLLFDRHRAAQGASIRNFGMIWPVGQPSGAPHELAMRSRALWLEAGGQANIWFNRCGSLHVAYHDDELAVLEEFGNLAANHHELQMLSPVAACERSPAVRRDGLLGALWSPTELCVDPREAIRVLPRWLAEAHGVELRFETSICEVDSSLLVSTDGRRWQAEQIVICSGDDFKTLFPDVLATCGMRRCKLQMLRTVGQPNDWRIGPHLAGGLTLRHYASFAQCPSLPALKRRIAAENPELDAYGIHVMASQNRMGEVILGDSHEYDAAIEPFDKARIDELILSELHKLIELPDWTIAERWHGIYAKHPTHLFVVCEPRPGVTVCTATGGAGMTLSFGIADDFWNLGEHARGRRNIELKSG
ncbi:MAG TPA: TIGR03364 family FAD-dependent oxidoreductase [Pirellulales bacterium]|nr:TIGR03364 family FAD-dependent oxidoreductase [Pirellulales bacterium]